MTAHVTAVRFAADQCGALCHVAEEGLSTSRSEGTFTAGKVAANRLRWTDEDCGNSDEQKE